MSADLRNEIQQTEPFRSLQQEAFLNLARTQAVLHDAFARMIEPYGVSPTQYNVLRILRGAEPNGLCRNEIRDRLVTRMPDVTRLLDRMEEAGLVTRTRSATDRRMVATHLTSRGRQIVDALDEPIAAEHTRRLGHLTDDQLRTLIELLALARQKT